MPHGSKKHKSNLMERFKAIVKPNSQKNEILGFDEEKQAYIVRIKAKPEDNKANIELVKFLSKEMKAKIRIVGGFKSKEKLLEKGQ